MGHGNAVERLIPDLHASFYSLFVWVWFVVFVSRSVKAPVDAFVGPAAQSHSASNGGTAHLSNGVATQGAEELQAHVSSERG